MIPVVRIYERKVFNSKYKSRFVIHEHHALRAGLHYDIRLEKNSVLKSWATRKLLDLIDGKVKRILLFQTPDHELDWFDFEGEITDLYGKGKVKIWDTGKYIEERWGEKTIVAEFFGKKIKGKFVFLNIQDNQWLMFRKKD